MLSLLARSNVRSPWSRATVPLFLGVALVVIVVAVLCVDTHAPFQPASTTAAEAAVSGWKISIGDESRRPGSQQFSGHVALNGVTYIPAGAAFEIETEPLDAKGCFADGSAGGLWEREGGELSAPVHSMRGWTQNCRAPNQAGLYRLKWLHTLPTTSPALAMDDHRVATGPQAAGPQTGLGLDVVVLTEAQQHPLGDRTLVKVSGKSIGNYLDPKLSPVRRVRENSNQYQVPRFFAILTPETAKVHLGEDFDLEQLIAFKDYHGPDGKKVITNERHTNVVPLCPALIQKLVKLRERLRQKGVKVTRFWITSGFRTPDYNHLIGGAAYSRHCYGDAVDLCIDEGGNHRMDDLNGDGKIDRKDGIIIANACRELEAEGAVVPGGIGVYEWDGEDSVRCHVHIDCRGYISRWGQIGSGRTRKSFVWWPKSEFQEDENGE